jgi:ABC-type branched-subunit amino acid transport system ATPase component/ABC-type branched-subunit amino acid transport system permease subunit
MRRFTVIALAVPVLAAFVSFFIPSYWLTLLIYIGINALVCLGLVVMTGYAGITSFGQAAFVGLGAYTTALLTAGLQLSPWLSLPVSIGLTVLLAWAIGWITVRLSGHYLVLGTFAWSIGLYYVFANVEVLGGYNGITGLPSLFLALGRDERIPLNMLIWGAVALSMLLTINILDSRPGRAVRAVRSRGMAESFGVDTARYKLAVFILAAAFAGTAGWLHAHFLRFVNPNPFHLNASVEYLFMAIIGGVSNLLGAIAGSLIVVVSKSWLQTAMPGLISTTGNYEIVAFGIVVLLLLHFAPKGVMAIMPLSVQLSSQRTTAAAGSLPSRTQPAPGTPVLRVDGVAKNFGGLRALDGVDFSVSAAEVVALVGPNGAGKSTLFDIVSGLTPLSSGAVTLMDKRIEGLDARAIAERGMARTFQHTHLRSEMTVLENVALGAHVRSTGGMLRAALRLERAEEASILNAAYGNLERLGLAAAVNAPAGSLSLGQQRIVEVARALTADPIIMLLDEPAAGLRYQEKRELAAAIEDMRARGIAVLLVEHDLEFVAQVASRVVVLDFGTKIAEGTPAEVVSNKRVVEAYLGTTDDEHERVAVGS